MNISKAKYHKLPNGTKNENIVATIDGVEMWIPLKEGNRHYDEIMRQVEAGKLTIQEADG